MSLLNICDDWMPSEKMINVTCTTELNRQKAIAASARTALSATDNNSTTSDNNQQRRRIIVGESRPSGATPFPTADIFNGSKRSFLARFFSFRGPSHADWLMPNKGIDMQASGVQREKCPISFRSELRPYSDTDDLYKGPEGPQADIPIAAADLALVRLASVGNQKGRFPLMETRTENLTCSITDLHRRTSAYREQQRTKPALWGNSCCISRNHREGLTYLLRVSRLQACLPCHT